MNRTDNKDDSNTETPPRRGGEPEKSAHEAGERGCNGVHGRGFRTCGMWIIAVPFRKAMATRGHRRFFSRSRRGRRGRWRARHRRSSIRPRRFAERIPSTSRRQTFCRMCHSRTTTSDLRREQSCASGTYILRYRGSAFQAPFLSIRIIIIIPVRIYSSSATRRTDKIMRYGTRSSPNVRPRPWTRHRERRGGRDARLENRCARSIRNDGV